MLAADKALARLIDGAIGADPDRPTVCALSYSVSPHQIDKFFPLCEGYGLTVQQLSAAEMMAAVGEERRPVAAGDEDDSGEERWECAHEAQREALVGVANTASEARPPELAAILQRIQALCVEEKRIPLGRGLFYQPSERETAKSEKSLQSAPRLFGRKASCGLR